MLCLDMERGALFQGKGCVEKIKADLIGSESRKMNRGLCGSGPLEGCCDELVSKEVADNQQSAGGKEERQERKFDETFENAHSFRTIMRIKSSLLVHWTKMPYYPNVKTRQRKSTEKHENH